MAVDGDTRCKAARASPIADPDPFVILGARSRHSDICWLAGHAQLRHICFGLDKDQTLAAIDFATCRDVPVGRIGTAFVGEPPFSQHRPSLCLRPYRWPECFEPCLIRRSIAARHPPRSRREAAVDGCYKLE